ncbi:MAG: Flp pilus assembly complex ATPase component TadA [Candidatus Riflebacteria bacterium]|nr:Flp pilus assembly complex ATPase component TadA [Candidatus Riflebacteria bacterium]
MMAQNDILSVLKATGKTFAGADLERARTQASSFGMDLGWVLLGMGLVSEIELSRAYSELYSLTLVSEEELTVQPEAASRIPDNIVRKYQIFPVALEGDELWIAICNPTGLKAAHAFARQEAIRVQVVLTTPSVLSRLISSRGAPAPKSPPLAVRAEMQTAPGASRPGPASPAQSPAAPEAKSSISLALQRPDVATTEEMFGKIESLSNESSTIEILDDILESCAHQQVSDLHISRTDDALVLRFRKDGVLTAQRLRMQPKNQDAVISRVKVLSELDVTEKRLPQDGSFEYSFRGNGRDVRYVCRASVMPTRNGEKVSLRLLEANARARSLDELGLSVEVLQQIRRIARSPSGLLLFTGPTGSGKTTAAYACLQEISNPAVSTFTVEDPIEFSSDHYYQIQVNEKIGLTFARVLRAILRQDPDVILVGEIRDPETAQIGATAALVGRLVLSTLHTNDAPGTITRMTDLGVPRYAIAAALRGAVAIRLLRRLCDCKRRATVTSAELAAVREMYELGAGEPCEPVGCEACHGSGFKGRLPVAEVLVMDQRLSDAVIDGQGGFEIRRAAQESGFEPLVADGWRRVLRGETSEREVVRHLGTVL